MSFLWPQMLALLAVLPLLAAVYAWLLRRRKRNAIRYSSLLLVREALDRGPGIRRHVPPALVLGAIALLLVGAARPSAMLVLPSSYRTCLLYTSDAADE